MKREEKNIYCSLDIETSDFDPVRGEVLEIGMVFFETEGNKVSVIKEWQSVFKPKHEVPARILALTNIQIEEIENAPDFESKRDEVQQLVENCIIVGHNINFDIGFLERFGLKFSGRQIDTLDLAQIFLPTNSSYNLEGLMNYLGVSHKDAHRALADAKATIVVIERLLAIYCSLSNEAKAELLNIITEESLPDLHALLQVKVEPMLIEPKDRSVSIAYSAEIAEVLKKKREIISFPLGFDYYSYIYGALLKSKEKILLVVPTKNLVYQLWKQKVAFPIFENKDLFDHEKFRENLNSGDLTAEQRLFFAKIVVWQATNWQTDVLYDLNFKVSGNQYKSLINSDSRENLWLAENEKVLAVDYLDFIRLNLEEKYSEYKILILDINGFEQALMYFSGKKVSWQDLIYSLKQIADPDNAYGKKELKKDVREAVKKVDEFFELAHANFSKLNSSGSYTFRISASLLQDLSYLEINAKAEELFSYLEDANIKFQSDRLQQNIENLKAFFDENPEEIKWIEIAEKRLTLLSSPISLQKISHAKLDAFKKIIFTASLGSEKLNQYFIERLDLQNFKVVKIGQQELTKKFQVVITSPQNINGKVLEILESIETPAALLMPNSSGLKSFYEANYLPLQKVFRVWAQGYSGGATKILENFSIDNNALLIATDNFINKQVGKSLKVNTLILTRLPFEQFTHPLLAAQAEKYENQFLDFSIPRALYNFHALIRFFYSADLKKIYLLDPKMGKEYGSYFRNYLAEFPFVEIIEE